MNIVNQMPQCPGWAFQIGRAPLTAVFFFMLMVQGIRCAEAEEETFTIEAGNAMATLKEFVAQSGRELIYSGAAVEGVQTSAVHGRFNPRAALDRMLAGTPLRAMEDEKTGALAVIPRARAQVHAPNRLSPASPSAKTRTIMTRHHSLLAWLGTLAVSLGSSSAGAQTGSAEGTNSSPEGESSSGVPIMMSTFEVNSTQDTGYVTKNSATAFKTDEALISIPQPVLVVTRDMITDIGYNYSSDVLAFAGVSDYYRGESYMLRGARVSYDLVDEMPGIIAYQDNIFVDSYEVIRGPAAVFYPTATLGGIILKTTRKPMAVAQTTINVSEDQFGTFRT
jgi:hypothetical protein